MHRSELKSVKPGFNVMKILALVMARSGSKRVPRKNIKLLGGKPLIMWTIDSANDVPEICDILVSTDDLEISSICKAAGVLSPWLRPKDLASDQASSVDAAIHALDWYEAARGPVDGVILLQPTSPFRSVETICKGIALFKKNDGQTVLGVSRTHDHPMWTMKIEHGCLVPLLHEHGFGVRSQDLPPAYVLNGSFYLITPENLRNDLSFIGQKSIPLLIESERESLDIDTLWDFKMAEAMLIINTQEFK